MGTKDLETLVQLKSYLRSAAFLFFAAILFAQCSSREILPEETVDNAVISLPKANRNLPTAVDTLRILAVGNSFTDDATRYLDKLVRAAGIDEKRLSLYVVSLPGYSLQQWLEVYNDSAKEVAAYSSVGKIEMKKEGTLRELFSQNWSIIVFQQYSQLSANFSTFNPYLSSLVQKAVQDCSNPNVCIAWQMTWNYWHAYTDFPVETLKYPYIINAAREMMRTNGITEIIPTGTAIENARHTSLNTAHDLTRDGVHLSYGTACYVAACTWFQKLVRPTLGIDVRDIKALWEIKSWEKNDTKYESVSVTEDNYKICQLCAVAAVENPFEITPISWE